MTIFGKYIFRTDFGPRFGQHPDESHMDKQELDDYDPLTDTIERNHWNDICFEEEQLAAQQVDDASPFSSDLDKPFGS